MPGLRPGTFFIFLLCLSERDHTYIFAVAMHTWYTCTNVLFSILAILVITCKLARFTVIFTLIRQTSVETKLLKSISFVNNVVLWYVAIPYFANAQGWEGQCVDNWGGGVPSIMWTGIAGSEKNNQYRYSERNMVLIWPAIIFPTCYFLQLFNVLFIGNAGWGNNV